MDIERTLTRKTECCVKRARPQGVVAIPKTACRGELRTLGRDTPNSRSAPPELLYNAHSTVAVMENSLDGRPVFARVVGVRRSWRRCYNHRNTVAPRRRPPG